MNTTLCDLQILSSEEWEVMESVHAAKIQPWVDAFRERRKRGLKHPVHDFLFEYYQCKRKLLTDWHPAPGMVLKGESAMRFLKDDSFSRNEEGVFLDPGKIDDTLESRISWITQLIDSARIRRTSFHCYGLHEWAMVYKSNCIRHQDTPLRLSTEEIERVIEAQTLRCTHYDAFRFFTDSAKPRNTLQPKPDDRGQNEQFGCVHFNMDLFKWCYKLSPWISSELTLECFFLAVEARELDMRASPYDLNAFGYEPIPIETADGRIAYQSGQKEIANKGRSLAARFLEECRMVLNMRILA
ncbi:MAG: 3-methyladenine DNA glycosylase [Verrucomicrobia bacterium]|nr:3-methyladenine DNA glycosylase [Verrucomicrobiota bacterium]